MIFCLGEEKLFLTHPSMQYERTRSVKYFWDFYARDIIYYVDRNQSTENICIPIWIILTGYSSMSAEDPNFALNYSWSCHDDYCLTCRSRDRNGRQTVLVLLTSKKKERNNGCKWGKCRFFEKVSGYQINTEKKEIIWMVLIRNKRILVIKIVAKRTIYIWENALLKQKC